MSSVETGQMSAVETGQMSAAETGQMSAVETRQMYSILRATPTAAGPSSNKRSALWRTRGFAAKRLNWNFPWRGS